MTYRLGVDVGGTFTDLVLSDVESNQLWSAKVPSTPANQAIGVTYGIQHLVDQLGLPAAEITSFIHGTTVATNALLERKTSRTALITTAGFRDVLEIGRQDRPQMYSWRVQRSEPLVPRQLRLEVRERTLPTGEILTPLSLDDLEVVVEALQAADVDGVAVCLLHSYANASHEQAIGKALAERLPELSVTLSSDILPEFKEYERMSTTTINAYVAPAMERYLLDLERSIAKVGIPAQLHIMQSNGGIVTAATAAEKPVHTVLSGPAGGVIGSVALAELTGEPNVISVDMGGTSFDIALTYQGAVRRTKEGEIGGLPVRSPMIDIHTLGAGGGSIAWIDTGGALRVGPHSAGADPGPACYAHGGEEPTVTDANLVLGRLSPDYFLGGDMRLDVAKAREVIQRRVAQPLNLSLEEAAAGIVRVVNANMVKGIRVVSVARGFDPREFCLMAFGGAGPMHAAELAAELDIPRVIVPPSPGVNCALGLLMADLRHDYVRTRLVRLEEVTSGELVEVYARLERGAIAQMEREGVRGERLSLVRSADLRYVGQGYELEVPVGNDCGQSGGQIDVDTIAARFHELHQRRYGFAARDGVVELVNLRLTATGLVPRPELPRESLDPPPPTKIAPKGRRPVYLDGSYYDTPIYERDELHAGQTIDGPAVIEQLDSTTVLWPGNRAHVAPYRNLVVQLASEAA